jgi:hypothetical protein
MKYHLGYLNVNLIYIAKQRRINYFKIKALVVL